MNAKAKKKDDDDALAAEYALGVLPFDERAVFARRLEQEALLQDKVREWDEHLVAIAAEAKPVVPPASILKTLENRLFGQDANRSEAGWFANVAFWRGLSVASLACLAALSAYTLGILGGRDVPVTAGSDFVAELSGETNAVRLVALFDRKAGVLRLNRTEGQAASGRTFELWLIEGGNNPVSLGVLPPENSSVITVPDTLQEKFDDAVLAISDEPENGSPTGQPTGDVLATGKVSRI